MTPILFQRRLRSVAFCMLGLIGLGISTWSAAQEPPAAKLSLRLAQRAEAALKDVSRREWTIEGTSREALLYIPAAAQSTPSPLVFAFHGHGGNMRNAAVMFDYQRVWPEAIVVYMQGLNTPGRLTD